MLRKEDMNQNLHIKIFQKYIGRLHFHLKIKRFLLISIATLLWWELIGVKKTSFFNLKNCK